MKTVLGVMLLMGSLAIYAGEKGNGGDAVVCRDANGEIISAELLDYYEGRVMRKIPIADHGDISNEEFIKKVGQKLNSLEDHYNSFNINEAIKLNRAIEDYLTTGFSGNEEILFTEDVLTDIPDSNELVMRKGCKVEQLAIWSISSFPEDPRFIIQADLLKHLSKRDIRGLVLHETIYKFLFIRDHLIGFNLKDSVAARYLHQKLMSAQIEDYTFRDYFYFIRNHYGIGNPVKCYCIRVDGKLLSLIDARPQDDGRIEIAIVNTDIEVVLDKAGKINRELTMKYGSLRVAPYFNSIIAGFDPGSITIDGMRLDFVNDYPHYMGLRFGKKEIKINLNKYPLGTGPYGDWGIKWNVFGKDKYVTVKAAPGPMDQVLRKTFELTFDEDFNLIVKEL